MKTIQLFTLIALLFLASCTEKNIENSRYKDYVVTLNDHMKLVDSAYTIFNAINHDDLLKIQQSAVAKYKLAKKSIKFDALDLFYETNMNIYKSIFVKELNNIEEKTANIKREYEYSKSQIEALIPNLIKENFIEDSAAIYFNSEKEALFILEKELLDYNSKANNAFNIKDSLDNNLDSLIRKYDKTNN